MELPRSSTLFVVFLALVGVFALVQVFQLQVPPDIFEPDDSMLTSTDQDASSRGPSQGSYYQVMNRNLRLQVDRLKRNLDEQQSAYATLQSKYNQLVKQSTSADTSRQQSPGDRPTAGGDEDNYSLHEEMLQVIASLQDEVKQLKADKAKMQQANPTEQNATASDTNDAQIQAEQDLEDMQVLLDDERTLRTAATQAMIGLGTSAVPALVSLLGHDSANVREWAAYVLGSIGQPAEDAVSSLMDSLNDPDESVRNTARAALNAIETAQ